MTVKLFEVDPILHDEVEIGRANTFKITTKFNSAPALNNMGSHLSPVSGAAGDIHIKLYGSQTPVPDVLPSDNLKAPNPHDAFSIARSTLHRPQTDNDNRDLVISALVHMLGGEVTIHPHELLAAARRDLRLYQQMDPHLIIVKTEDT